MQTPHDHHELKRNLKRFISNEINPFVDEWEAAEIFPAHELFKKMGDQGLLGISRPVEYGGLGLDYSYSVACVGVSEARAGSDVPAIQTSARRAPNPHPIRP